MTLQNIAPRSSGRGAYTITSDSKYVVDVQFSSGKRLRESLGYVTNGFDVEHAMAVSESTIEIREEVWD